MKNKLLTVFLIALSCFANVFAFSACDKTGDSGNSGDNNSVEVQPYKVVAIAMNETTFEAGNSYEIEIRADGELVQYNKNFEFTITKNFDHATVSNGRLFIKNSISDKEVIEFYTTYNDIISNKLSITVNNTIKANEEKIAILEANLKSKRSDLSFYQSEMQDARQKYENAKTAYEDYDAYCKRMGYLSYGGDWLTNNESVRTEHDRMFYDMDIAYYDYTDLYSQVEDLQSEIRSLESEILELKSN